jgi:hypothetical protein
MNKKMKRKMKILLSSIKNVKLSDKLLSNQIQSVYSKLLNNLKSSINKYIETYGYNNSNIKYFNLFVYILYFVLPFYRRFIAFIKNDNYGNSRSSTGEKIIGNGPRMGILTYDSNTKMRKWTHLLTMARFNGYIPRLHNNVNSILPHLFESPQNVILYEDPTNSSKSIYMKSYKIPFELILNGMNYRNEVIKNTTTLLYTEDGKLIVNLNPVEYAITQNTNGIVLFPILLEIFTKIINHIREIDIKPQEEILDLIAAFYYVLIFTMSFKRGTSSICEMMLYTLWQLCFPENPIVINQNCMIDVEALTLTYARFRQNCYRNDGTKYTPYIHVLNQGKVDEHKVMSQRQLEDMVMNIGNENINNVNILSLDGKKLSEVNSRIREKLLTA